jgi:hypothetical protein
MFKYTKIHKVLGEGNFVLTVSEGNGMGRPHVFYDLLRMKEWKSCRALGCDSRNPYRRFGDNNGMFNF